MSNLRMRDFVSLNEATDLYLNPTNPPAGTMGIRTGSTGYAAAPGRDSQYYPPYVNIEDYTNFAYIPGPGGNANTTALVSYAVDMTTFLKGLKISYLGLYYGSIDNYNDIAFYSGSNLIRGQGDLSDGVLTGAEILRSQGGTSGNQYQPGSNVYVNIFFDPNETFTAFEFRNATSPAFELDNIVIGVTAVPEPATMLLLGLGLVGLAGVRRRFKK